MLIVGFSRLKAWRRCHRLHWYKYHEFLKKRRPRVQLLRGTILHAMLDARAKGESATKVLAGYEKEFKKLFAEQRDEYGDLIGDCRKIFDSYCETYADDGLEVIASEQEIRHEILPGIEFKGTIDRVYLEKKTKRRWLSDSKSHKNLPGEENRFNDLQTLFYQWLWNLVNPRRPVDGVMWDYLRTKLPAEPEVLKSGKLSQRANIDTTYEVAAAIVAAHCKKTKEDPKDYAEWLNELKGRENKFLRRILLPSPPRIMVETIVAETKTTALEIRRAYEGDRVDNTRNLTKECSWCEFRDLCHADLRGQDSDFIRKTDFIVDQELKEEEYAEED